MRKYLFVLAFASTLWIGCSGCESRVPDECAKMVSDRDNTIVQQAKWYHAKLVYADSVNHVKDSIILLQAFEIDSLHRAYSRIGR